MECEHKGNRVISSGATIIARKKGVKKTVTPFLRIFIGVISPFIGQTYMKG